MTKASLSIRSTLTAALSLAAFCALGLSVRAQTVITSLPSTISIPGNYVLNSNLSYNGASGNAITFATGSITLDFQGHYISNLAAGKSTNAIGLRATNRGNITIKNGTVVGFSQAIFFDSSSGGQNNVNNVIENMRIWANTFIGIDIEGGLACRIEGCQVSKTGGRIPAESAIGIIMLGAGNLVRNNLVSTVTAGANHTAQGIQAVDAFVVGNQIAFCETAVYQGKYQNNLTIYCPNRFVGGVDAGGNN